MRKQCKHAESTYVQRRYSAPFASRLAVSFASCVTDYSGDNGIAFVLLRFVIKSSLMQTCLEDSLIHGCVCLNTNWHITLEITTFNCAKLSQTYTPYVQWCANNYMCQLAWLKWRWKFWFIRPGTAIAFTRQLQSADDALAARARAPNMAIAKPVQPDYTLWTHWRRQG